MENSWFGDNCSICGPVSFFVRGVIWHWTERYNCNIMSRILSFLTLLTLLPVGSTSSSHRKISAIYWCHFLVWVLIPIDGAAIDGDMLSIVLRTFLARSSYSYEYSLVRHDCHYNPHGAKLLILQRLRQNRIWSNYPLLSKSERSPPEKCLPQPQ